jgi:hypothetical protein
VWDQPLFYELTSSKRRGKPGIVAYGFGVIGRIESSAGDVFGIVAEVAEFAPGMRDLLGVVYLCDAVMLFTIPSIGPQSGRILAHLSALGGSRGDGLC